jgi:hypothetical protein
MANSLLHRIPQCDAFRIAPLYLFGYMRTDYGFARFRQAWKDREMGTGGYIVTPLW